MNMLRPASIGIVLLLIATFTVMPTASAQGPQTTLALTISMASVTPQQPLEAFDADPPLVFDFDGDGIKEIIVHNDNRRVYVFDSQSGQLDAEILTKYPPGWGARPINGVEAAVLQFGGVPHLVVANSAAYITVLRYEEGPSSPGNFVFTKLWETRTDDCEPLASMDAKPVLADLNDDGTFEILVQTEEVGVFALRMDGSTMWKQCIGGGNGKPAVADIDFDGQVDVIWASDGGVVTAMNGKWGTTKWTFWANHPSFNLHSASIPTGPSIGQVDGVGPLDVVFGARDSHDADDWSNDHAALFVVKGNGQLLWMRQDPGGAPLTYTRPIIADVDGNGQADIIWADWNTVGHKPPAPDSPDAWMVTGPAHFYRYDSQGNMIWRTSLDTYWQNKDLALADVDNDGVQEVLANGPGPGGDGIWYLNAITGAKETFIKTHPWKVSRGPVVEDLWNTGTMQWVLPVSAAAAPATGGAILVFDTHAPYNAMWPHLPYPVIGEGSGPPPPPGTFNPTFTVPASVNNWWVEVAVNAPSVVSSVTASVNDGPPVGLTKQSWGNWAKSFNVATGAKVVFTATNVQGQVASSQEFSWLGSAPPPPPPPPGDFEAGFTVPSSVNNWWVEVRVDANKPVSSVSASVDGGTAVSLAKQSWGNWAKSFHVPTGAMVKFTAKDAGGQSVVSEAFQWLGSAPPPPPPPGTFTATFAVPSTVNNWWVETKVTANSPVAAVTATVDGGSPVALTKQSWGNWAKSFNVPTGSDVQFKATDGQGRTVTSQVFEWLSDGSAFSATFTVSDPSNNWWVETYVTSNKPLTKVEVQVDGGAWTVLPKTSWGSYAKSFFVPDNAQVKFRATSTAGDVATSGTTTWI